MKLLFVVRNPSFFVQYENVVRWLCGRGHKVCFLLSSPIWRNAQMDEERLKALEEETKGSFTSASMAEQKGFKAWLLRNTREILNYAAYLRDEHPISTSPYMINRQSQVLYFPMNILMRTRLLHCLFFRKDRVSVLRWIDRVLSPQGSVVDQIKEYAPDLVVASPFIFSRSRETEYIKAAKSMRISTAAVIFSWDNLTSKGIFQVIPDTVIVWNKAQVKELQEIHRVEDSHIIWAGAPSMDFWFRWMPERSRAEFCREHGLDPEKPYLLYLASSQTIAPDENVPVADMLKCLTEKMGENVPAVVIRPHPLNIKIWDGFEHPGVTVVPKENKDIFYSIEAKKLFAECVYHSFGIVGLNTTAMIEASILDKPSITLVVDRYADTQKDSGHFHHIADYGFMTNANGNEEFVDVVADLMKGNDPGKDARRRFVIDFVRPWGWDRDSHILMGTALEILSNGKGAKDVLDTISGSNEGMSS